MTESETCEQQALLRRRALLMAANYDHQELVRQLLSDFAAVLHRIQVQPKSQYAMIHVNRMFMRCLGDMRKLGMREETSTLIEHVTSTVMRGQTVFQMRAVAVNECPATVQI